MNIATAKSEILEFHRNCLNSNALSSSWRHDDSPVSECWPANIAGGYTFFGLVPNGGCSAESARRTHLGATER
jgi:hypothetical protein